jgi:hypothetical protein
LLLRNVKRLFPARSREDIKAFQTGPFGNRFQKLLVVIYQQDIYVLCFHVSPFFDPRWSDLGYAICSN